MDKGRASWTEDEKKGKVEKVPRDLDVYSKVSIEGKAYFLSRIKAPERTKSVGYRVPV